MPEGISVRQNKIVQQNSMTRENTTMVVTLTFLAFPFFLAFGGNASVVNEIDVSAVSGRRDEGETGPAEASAEVTTVVDGETVEEVNIRLESSRGKEEVRREESVTTTGDGKTSVTTKVELRVESGVSQTTTVTSTLRSEEKMLPRLSDVSGRAAGKNSLPWWTGAMRAFFSRLQHVFAFFHVR